MSFCKKLCVALLGAALLAGCGETGTAGGLSFLDTSSNSSNAPTTSAHLANGQIIVSGPEGYCIDASTLRSTTSGGFAAIASCNILSGGQSGPIVEPVLVTVTVSRSSGSAPDVALLAAALDTKLKSTRDLSSVTAGQLESGGETAFNGSDPRHWRGSFVLGNRLVGLALYAPKESPLLGAQGAAFLNTISSRIRANARVPKHSAEQSQRPVDPQVNRLGRLFRSSNL